MKKNRENIEHLTCALTGEPLRAELLAEGSMLYRMLGDAGMMYSGLSVLVLGTVQPQTIQGLKDHEPIFQKQKKVLWDFPANVEALFFKIIPGSTLFSPWEWIVAV